MVDPTTVNTSLAIPIRGSDVGTWDLPVNGNFNAIDAMFGGVATIALTSASITLLSTQGQQSVFRFTGTLTANVAVVLPNIFKGWTVDNQITNSPSSFAVLLATSGSTYFLGAPPGQNDVFYDGTTIYYRNMGKIGEYWDYASSGVPTWVSASTKPPYLNCNGTTFSSATYPILTSILGSTTLPDSRGRVRMALTQGTSLVSSAVSGLGGDTIFASGGDQNMQSHTHTSSGTITVSGTTSSESANHNHAGSGTTTTESATHAHVGSGTTAADSVDHTHNYTVSTAGGAVYAPGGSFATATIATSGVSAFHTHTYSFTTGTESATHTHDYSFTTGTQSVSHTHTFSSSGSFAVTTSATGSGASQNVQPTFVGGITLIRAA
jgi:hypothetical protein